jgi:hypothetical protein
MLVAGLSGAFVLAYFVYIIYQWRRLSHVPGPFWAAFSKGWMVRESLRRRQPWAIQEVTQRYGECCSFNIQFRRTNSFYYIGSLARIGPNELVTDDPKILRKMMAVRSAYSRGDCMRPVDE